MPRGNLEGIYPRITMIKEIVEDVEAKRYGKAFRALRQHKIDINLLYDVDPEKFLENISDFVEQVKQVDFLNLFINGLLEQDRGKELDFIKPATDEDRIKKEHLNFITKSISGGEVTIKGKINKICEALKEELWKRN